MGRLRSLFLPLGEDEHAVFAGVFPLILTASSSIEAAAAAAAGEQRSRPTHTSDNGASAAGGLYSRSDDSGCRVEGNFSSTSFHPSREPASEVQARHGGPLRSLIFAVGSSRAEALLVVLRSAQIVVFGLDRDHSPPYVLYRIKPLATTQQLQVARERASYKFNSSGSDSRCDGSTMDAAEATCASLIPLSISYCARIVVTSDGRGHGNIGGRRSVEEAAGEEEIYIRGLVGGSDGRVRLFSDVAYTFSFAAHEVPVAQVDAVLLPPCSLNTNSVSYNYYKNNTNNYGSFIANRSQFESPATSRQTSVLASRERAALGTTAFIQAQKQQQRQDNLQRAMERLGIVTSGVDGVVLLWRRIDGAMSPIVLLRPSSFARRMPYTVYYPSTLSALLSAIAPKSSRAAAIDAELSCPPSCLVHPTSQHARGLRVRQFASLASVMAPSSSALYAPSASSGQSTDWADAAQRAAPTWLSLPMPGSWTMSVTAMASHHSVTLIARETSLFSVVRFDTRSATRIWKSKNAITQIELQDTMALVVCAKQGEVHILTIHPVTGHGMHQYTYYAYKNRPILHASLHEASLLVSIVDLCGSTELVQLPNDVLHQCVHPLYGGYTLGSAECLNLLASMAALRAKVSIEEVKGSDAKGGAPDSANSMYKANAALDELNERLLLARLAVPEECDRYMAAGRHVF